MKSFKSYNKKTEQLHEGFLGSLLSGVASFIIKGIIKFSKLQTGLFGTEEVGSLTGMRYFLQDGKMIRFNHSGKTIKSIDVWNDNANDWDTPSISFDLEKLKDIVGFIPIFAKLLRNPKVDLSDLDNVDQLSEQINEELISESIIDIPRKTYSRGVFDDADTDNPKLKPEVIKMINNQIDQFGKKYPVVKYSLIGSILTKRYRQDADLDINVLFDVPEKEREAAHEELRKSLKGVNGKLIPGTKHPVNYFVIVDPKIKEKNDSMADGVFNIVSNKFDRKPEEETFEPEKYEADFQKKVRELDVTKSEMFRDLVDYEELKELSDDDISNLQGLLDKKLKEIQDSLETVIEIGDKTIEDRANAFKDDMTPEQIKNFGKKHKLPKNVIYKMLEKYHYLTFYKKCKEILDDNKISDDEIDSLKEQSLVKKVQGILEVRKPGRPKGSTNKVKETVSRIKSSASRGTRKKSSDIQADEAEKKLGKELKKYSDPKTVFDDLRFGTEMVADGVQNSLLVTGTGGIGKTETVLRTLAKKGKKEGKDYQLIKGTVTAAGMYTLFATYPDQIIVFDDADSAFRSQDAKNLLKAALDTKPVRRMNYTIKKSFNPDDFERGSEEWDEKIEKGFVPSKVDFTGRVIFISNLEPEKMDQAVRSRSIVVDIRLTEEGIVDLIEKLSSEISFHGVGVQKKHVKEALKLMRDNLSSLKEITIRAFVLIAKSMYAADKAKVNAAQKKRLIKMATGGLLG